METSLVELEVLGGEGDIGVSVCDPGKLGRVQVGVLAAVDSHVYLGESDVGESDIGESDIGKSERVT